MRRLRLRNVSQRVKRGRRTHTNTHTHTHTPAKTGNGPSLLVDPRQMAAEFIDTLERLLNFKAHGLKWGTGQRQLVKTDNGP